MSNLNVFRHFHVHPVLWVMVGVGILTGSFLQLLSIFLIVLAHELGHYGMALFFRWRIRTVMLWPFGGVMETDEHHTRPFKEEAAVILAGPFQHLWIFGVIAILDASSILSSGLVELLYTYNVVILLFNLLPIWPLDGGKIMFLLLSHHFPFVKAQVYSLYCSLVLLVVTFGLSLFFFPFSLSTIMLGCFLLWENRLEWKQRQYAFLRYLLRRYEEKRLPVNAIHSIHVSEDLPINQIFKQFKRGTHHQIFVNFKNNKRAIIDEGECLYYYFTLKQSSASAKELADWCAT
ncbi:stage IV sporulation protein FB [Pontibacillus yanchengensis]|uniref:Stage IV sporulation protein FB n=2 Tax=Pontibacillus yanchengensis TaxID=462910 RepID=A0A6I5A3F5_9BACI|nr:M50 family metallopeptidase [Pontibacillus yanchengensis]MYL33319.1 stage IV sporulation protein FB [Pontibacillus yanchengensis]MYL53367.1 stage IV sporulation protein FB [Pontibacillus yanchengensis]